MRRAGPLAAFVVALAALCARPVSAQAPPVGEFAELGPVAVQRAPGAPSPQVMSFNVVNPGSPHRLRIKNGSLVDPAFVNAFSADVLLNGVPVVTFAELNKKTLLLDKPVALAATNELSVTVHGRPAARIGVEILGQDNDLPTILASADPPPNAAGWNNSDVVVTFTCSDATSGVASCEEPPVVTTEGDAVVVTGTVFDRAGRSATASITLKIDLTPPTISIGTPPQGSDLHDQAAVLEGAVFDQHGVAVVLCAAGPANRVGDAFNCSVPLTEGPNTIVAQAVDIAGNVGAASVLVNRVSDFDPPIVSLSSPLPGALFNTASVDVHGHVDDVAAEVEVNGRTATLVPGGAGADFVVNDVSIEEGSNVLTATARDHVGNAGTASVQIVRDTVAPAIVVDDPVDGTITPSATIGVSGMINEMVVGTFNNEQGSVTVNGLPAVVSNRTFTVAGVPLASGVNILSVVGTDRAGNDRAVSVSVTRAAATGARIVGVSGSGQVGPVSQALPNPLVARVLDEAGLPVAGATVIFKVVEDDGTLEDATYSGKRALAVTTGGGGLASVGWTIGGRSGAASNRVEAYSVGFDGTAVFTAGGTAGIPSHIYVDGGANQIGATQQPLARPLVVVVTDDGHNRIEAVPVTFTVTAGGASFGGQPSVTVATDSDGRASAIPTLGPLEGHDTTLVEATFSGNVSASARFTVTSLDAGDAGDTVVSGVVVDNSNQPVPSVTLKLRGTQLIAITNAQGQFKFTGAPVGTVVLEVDGSTTTRPGVWPMLLFDLVTVAGRDNTVGMPIYLLPLDLANGVFVDETHGGTVTLADIPGFALDVAPGSATFPDGSRSGRVHVTAVHTDKVPMLPSFGSQPRLTVTIQPAGVHFDPPARLTVPNLDGLAPGAIVDMYSFDHDLGQFVGIGTGAVVDDGTVIRSRPGVGVVKGGWHYAGPPAPSGDLGPCSAPADGAAGAAAPPPKDGEVCCVCGPCATCDALGSCVPDRLDDVAAVANDQTNDNSHVIFADTTTPVNFRAEPQNAHCSALTYSWFVGEQGTVVKGQNATYRYQTPGPHTAILLADCGGCTQKTATVVVTVLRVRVVEADLGNDRIRVQLEPAGYQGDLKLEHRGPSPHVIRTETNKPSGDHLGTWDINNFPVGDYTDVRATWTVQGFDAVGETRRAMHVMGVIRHSQYNGRRENCSGGGPVQVYLTMVNAQGVLPCFSAGQYVTTTFRSTFVSQVNLNGPGESISYGPVQREWECLRMSNGAYVHQPVPANAYEHTFRRVTAFEPRCRGLALDDHTVAVPDGGVLACGDQIFINTIGIKTVTDRCPACPVDQQVDNFTTNTNCAGVNDLGHFMTVKLLP